jgi:2-polyprenyl-3-methyl-5-hydroxy-6-metoxy-1,4-benzoquinol methylase
MNEFDVKAEEWDLNPMHWNRSEAIVMQILKIVPLKQTMNALEFGAGTGIASFLLKDHLKEITLMDNSKEMVRVTNEKIKSSGSNNLKVIEFDLETADYNGKFDLIFTQMVLHHVNDIGNIIKKFWSLLNPKGYVVIADLYEEDGSFHGEDFTGHKGFNIDALSEIIRKSNFSDIKSDKVFTIDKKISETESKQFDVFLLSARKI